MQHNASEIVAANEVVAMGEVVTPGEQVAAEPWNPEYRAIDRRLREYARHRSALDASEAFDLIRAEQLKIASIRRRARR